MTELSTPQERSFVVLPVSVRLSDTDLFQHINNVSYLAFIEGVRGEFFAAHGCDLRKELAMTRRMEINYLKPATFWDPLVALVRIIKVGMSSIELEVHIANRDDHSIVYVESKMVQIHCCAKTGKKCPVSDGIREGLKAAGQID